MQMEMTRHALLQMRERGVLGEFVGRIRGLHAPGEKSISLNIS